MKSSILKWLGIVALLVGAVVILVLVASAQDRANDVSTGAVAAITPYVDGTDWFRGAADAQVIITEYGDFQCPACGLFYPVVKQLDTDYGDRVKFVFRSYPLTSKHPNALGASYAAEAAGKQGKFWEMHDTLYEHQSEWADVADPTTLFLTYATNIGLNTDQFTADIASGDVRAKVANDMKSGDAARVPGTPTFYVNGFMIKTPNGYTAFTQVIEDKLAEIATQ